MLEVDDVLDVRIDLGKSVIFGLLLLDVDFAASLQTFSGLNVKHTKAFAESSQNWLVFVGLNMIGI